MQRQTQAISRRQFLQSATAVVVLGSTISRTTVGAPPADEERLSGRSIFIIAGEILPSINREVHRALSFADFEPLVSVLKPCGIETVGDLRRLLSSHIRELIAMDRGYVELALKEHRVHVGKKHGIYFSHLALVVQAANCEWMDGSGWYGERFFERKVPFQACPGDTEADPQKKK